MRSPVNIKYLLAAENDRQWGTWVNTVGSQHVPPDSFYPLRNHPDGYYFTAETGRVLDEYQLIYITSGRGIFHSESCEEKTINEGDFILLFPGEWHTYMPDKKTGWFESWIGFKGKDMDNKVRNNFFSTANPVINLGINLEISRLFSGAIEVAKSQQPGYQQILGGIVNLLIGIIYARNKDSSFKEQKINIQINSAKTMMFDNIMKNITPQDVAKNLNLSYSWFRKAFKEYTGLAPSQYLNELRIQKAREMLRNTTLSIKEISHNMNFENTEYFYKAFKSKVNMTPIQYRKFSQRKISESE